MGGRGTPYRRPSPAREGRRAACGILVLLLAAAGGGCSTTAFLDDGPVVTGSVPKSHVPEGKAPHGIAASDWTEAKRALGEALASKEKDVSVPWENAATGMRGTATPIGPAGESCREFLIAVVDGKVADRWVRGAACRDGSGTVLSQVRVLGKA